MTVKPKRSKPPKAADKNKLFIPAAPGKSDARQMADISLDPAAHALAATRMFNHASFSDVDTTELYLSLSDKLKQAGTGDLSHQKALLAAQADALNSIFTEMARRAAANMGQYTGATESYMRLGLKAQAQCRATIEALDRLSSGRVQTVKHVHVNEGGQAIVAEQFHQHTGGKENGNSIEQPHATGPAGESPALSGPDALGQAVPIASSEGEGPLPHARRQRQRRAEGKP